MKDYRQKWTRWIVKINFLKEQIEKLELLKDFPIISISVFLLKSQLIEFELKQTILTLDLRLSAYSSQRTLKRHIRTPKEFDNYTLGKLVFEISQFEGNALLDNLKIQLKQLVSLRNKFTHHLFSPAKDAKQLTIDSEEGIKLANETLKILEIIKKELKIPKASQSL